MGCKDCSVHPSHKAQRASYTQKARHFDMRCGRLASPRPLHGSGRARLRSPTAQDKTPVLLVVGRLGLGRVTGLSGGQGWVELLTKKLATEGYRYRVVNASISGDTTAGGRARLPALLAQHKPAIVIVELGGNDALRGGKLATTRDNLDAMVPASQAAGAQGADRRHGDSAELRAGVRARVQGRVRRTSRSARKVPLVPSFFAGFGEDLAFFQPDRIHPTAAAQARLLDNVWPQLTPLLRRNDRRPRTRSGVDGARSAPGPHRRAQSLRVRDRPHSGRDQPAGARRRASARKWGRFTRRSRASRPSATARRSSRATSRTSSRRTAATSRATGRRSCTAGAAASAAARSRTC